MTQVKTSSKRRVLALFTDFFAQYVAVGEARAATLFGRGYETEIFKNIGIRPDRCIVVEHSPARREEAKQSGFLYCEHLKDLGAKLKEYGLGGLDLAHFDFGETFQRRWYEVHPHMKHFTGTTGANCVAITTADMRGNDSLRAQALLIDTAAEYFGSKDLAVTFFAHLLAEQHRVLARSTQRGGRDDEDHSASPEKGAVKELGFFLAFRKMLLTKRAQLRAAPDNIQRYIYRSDWSENGSIWRMRTYMFHLVPVSEDFDRMAHARQLRELWMRSPLAFIDTDGKLKRIKPQYQPAPASEEKDNSMRQRTAGSNQNQIQFPLLEQLMGVISPETKAELERVMALARSAHGHISALGALSQKFRDAADELNGLVPGLPNGNHEPVPQGNGTVTKQREQAPPTQNGEELNFDLSVDLLRALAQGGGAKELAFEKVFKALGIVRKKNRSRVVGGMLASTHTNRFRSQFVMRLFRLKGKAVAKKLLPELCELWKRVDKVECDPEKLYLENEHHAV